MKKVQAFSILTITALFLIVLFKIDPFNKVTGLLTYCFSAGANTAKNQVLYQDHDIQETSGGQTPLTSLKELSTYVEKNPQLRKIYLIGNSQTMSIVLPPSESVQAEPARTYPDLINDALKAKGENLFLYRLSAPNISYPEALWYTYFVCLSEKLRPSTIIIQLNYESFRKSDIRDGMLELLGDDAFRSLMENVAKTDQPFADTFKHAIERYDELRTRQSINDKTTGDQPSPEKTSETGINTSYGWGNAVETRFRDKVDKTPLIGKRHDVKQSFLDVLYFSRVFILGIKPSSPRPLGGAPFNLSVSCLAQIADLCKSNGITLELFNAPQNPQAVLYKTQNDLKLYTQGSKEFAAQRNIPYYDFGNSLPQPYWGIWVDGPDPIHFGLGGHRAMAKVFLDSGIVK